MNSLAGNCGEIFWPHAVGIDSNAAQKSLIMGDRPNDLIAVQRLNTQVLSGNMYPFLPVDAYAHTYQYQLRWNVQHNNGVSKTQSLHPPNARMMHIYHHLPG